MSFVARVSLIIFCSRKLLGNVNVLCCSESLYAHIQLVSSAVIGLQQQRSVSACVSWGGC